MWRPSVSRAVHARASGENSSLLSQPLALLGSQVGSSRGSWERRSMKTSAWISGFLCTQVIDASLQLQGCLPLRVCAHVCVSASDFLLSVPRQVRLEAT